METAQGIRFMPTDEQIEGWLSSPQVIEWTTRKLSRHCPVPRQLALLTRLITLVKSDKNSDWRVEDERHRNFCLGINAMTWTLWAGFKYQEGVILMPDCPFQLKDYASLDELDTVEIKRGLFTS